MLDSAHESGDRVEEQREGQRMWSEAVPLVAGLVLVLMAFAPVAPSNVPRSRLCTRIARQMHLWDRYLYHDPRVWHPRD